MLIFFESKLWRQGKYLYVSVVPPPVFFGSMMSASLRVGSTKAKTRIFDLSGSLATRIPPILVKHFNLHEGDTLKGSLLVREFPLDLKIRNNIKSELDVAGVTLDVLSPAEQRQAILFIKEASTPCVRRDRIDALIRSCRSAENTAGG